MCGPWFCAFVLHRIPFPLKCTFQKSLPHVRPSSVYSCIILSTEFFLGCLAKRRLRFMPLGPQRNVAIHQPFVRVWLPTIVLWIGTKGWEERRRRNLNMALGELHFEPWSSSVPPASMDLVHEWGNYLLDEKGTFDSGHRRGNGQRRNVYMRSSIHQWQRDRHAHYKVRYTLAHCVVSSVIEQYFLPHPCQQSLWEQRVIKTSVIENNRQFCKFFFRKYIHRNWTQNRNAGHLAEG